MNFLKPLIAAGLGLWVLAIAAFAALPFLAVRSLRSGDERRYARWFAFVRVVLGVVMAFYALVKPYMQLAPRAAPPLLLRDVGDFELFWYFFSLKRLYVWFTCGAELLAGVLILWNRTQRFGLLLMCAIMANITVMDFAYLHDQPVRFWALALLIAASSCVVRELPVYLGAAKRLLVGGPDVEAATARATTRG